MLVEVAARGEVRILTLARPPVNAIDLDLVRALTARIEAAALDRACHALVLTGRPGVFSAGIDTKRVPAYPPAERVAMLRGINRMVLELFRFPKPAVAAISGHALGGGLVLALACDLRLAARGDFQIGLTEARAGIPFPAGPRTVLEATIAPERVRFLALTAAVLRPDDPALAGVIDRVVDAEQLDSAALAAAGELAALPGYAAVKQQLRAGAAARLREIVERDDEPLLRTWL